MSLPLVVANMKAIALCWQLARSHGMASVYYCPIENKLEVHPGRYHVNSLQGQVGKGLANTALAQLGSPSSLSNNYLYNSYGAQAGLVSQNAIQVMYGIRHPYVNTGSSVLSTKLSNLICNYTSTVHHAAQRIASSYGELWTLGGVDTNDAPLLKAVMDKMEEDIIKSRRGILPEGSDYKGYASSLTDLDTILNPFERSISTESGVPLWLLFPYTANSSFDLETRTTWATNLFEKEVVPVLINLLRYQGYAVTAIKPPSYRDSLYEAQVEAALADVEYKRSATESTYAGIELVEEQARALRLANDNPVVMESKDSGAVNVPVSSTRKKGRKL